MGRPHGVHGGMRVFLHNRESDHFLTRTEVLLRSGDETHTRRIDAVRPTGKGYLLNLVDVTSREKAEELKGARICVHRDELPTLKPGEFYVTDLIGIEAWDAEERLGQISSCREQGGIEVATIRGDKEEIQVPLVDEYVVEIDMDERRISLCNSALLPRNKLDSNAKK
ncbi:MAG: 16S rRNA processing protein RimM [Deltaproteobacteria bacterium]|nr:16S rRNA processing protein RimM [Deltaproteobacteria bacterium]